MSAAAAAAAAAMPAVAAGLAMPGIASALGRVYTVPYQASNAKMAHALTIALAVACARAAATDVSVLVILPPDAAAGVARKAAAVAFAMARSDAKSLTVRLLPQYLSSATAPMGTVKAICEYAGFANVSAVVGPFSSTETFYVAAMVRRAAGAFYL